ncbi:hypothetical protein TI39_contig4114g00015 [Zymoseptoria brevis]|uniref:GPI anchored protein n=1 Tax=Zymoseptoria brevis TaxID=1047168 RepID=A0A0F4GGR5_9PEZI|nr:hypothetical protein TI39_contig4114g00015 [Zymoseptoria brevis]
MRFHHLLLALATTSLAQQFSPDQTDQALSVLSVLQTALPTTLVQEFLTNSAAAASQIQSAFNAGDYPAWFTALPSDVQIFLVPAGLPTATATLVESSSMVTGTSEASESGSTTSTSTGTSTRSSSRAETSRASETSEGGASPTGVVGLGVAGVIGLVGLLAL